MQCRLWTATQAGLGADRCRSDVGRAVGCRSYRRGVGRVGRAAGQPALATICRSSVEPIAAGESGVRSVADAQIPSWRGSRPDKRPEDARANEPVTPYRKDESGSVPAMISPR